MKFFLACAILFRMDSRLQFLFRACLDDLQSRVPVLSQEFMERFSVTWEEYEQICDRLARAGSRMVEEEQLAAA